MPTQESDNMLMLSGIQHFVFCPRQWALIHIEQQWAENQLTVEGENLHSRVDDPTIRMLNNNTITLRRVAIASNALGLYGFCDAIELVSTDDLENSICHPKYQGRYFLHPVEYKKGHQKSDDCDVMQLVAQVLCLEEMYNVRIDEASLFYFEVRRREKIAITDTLRSNARFYAQEMRRIYDEAFIPPASYAPRCRRCSLFDICMPEKNRSVNDYLKQNMR